MAQTVSQELIGKIKDKFDLNLYETKVWLALLGKGVASVGELASISRVPRSRTYDVLESLEKKGFAIIRMGKPVKYLGVQPKIILERMKEKVKRDAHKRIEKLSKLTETEEFYELNSLYNNSIDPVKKEDISASIKGKSNITTFLREVIANAESEVILCTNAEEFKSKSKLFASTISELEKNNVKVRIALSGDKRLIEELKKKFKTKIISTEIEAKFFIVDKKEILFYISKEEKEDVAVWLNSEFFVQAFSVIFEKAIGGK